MPLRSLLRRLLTVVGLAALCCARTAAGEFTVVAYNVENLFDVDGVALYRDYLQDEPGDPLTYTRRKLLTKIQHTAAVLKTLNAGAGPEVILFQELEADLTPRSAVVDLNAFLRDTRGLTAEQMLTTNWQAEYAGLPSEAWLLKGLSDVGLLGYSVVVAPSTGLDAGIAHSNAVFSRFPVRDVQRHALQQAPDILEVTLEVDGHSLIVYVNHWKSGASNPEREPIRVQNATVLRALIDARLAVDPQADILIGGDLNSHYNHAQLYPAIHTGIHHVLGSQGDERSMAVRGTTALYNLWFELPPEQRYSEVWRGRRGTLMHLLVAGGLYDARGVGYVDGSFDKLVLPGLNADALGRPLRWTFAGEAGGGVSDHFPVFARFSTRPFEFKYAASFGDDAPSYELPLGYSGAADLRLDDGRFLGDVQDAELGAYVGRLYRVEATVSSAQPLRLTVGAHEWPVYVPDQATFDQLIHASAGQLYSLVIRLGMYRGERQLVVEGLCSPENEPR
jgi:endonuclease/exonuclease/phosphatase family metal-dependent hydrolase